MIVDFAACSDAINDVTSYSDAVLDIAVCSSTDTGAAACCHTIPDIAAFLIILNKFTSWPNTDTIKRTWRNYVKG
jgi:hypothetical protein